MSTVHPRMIEWLKSMSQKNFPGLDSYTLGVIKRLMMMGYRVKFKEKIE